MKTRGRFAEKTKTDFERLLNKQGVPDYEKKRIIKAKNYGLWLRQNDLTKFDELYREWLKGGENVLELWKDVPDFEAYYQISNLGRLKSKDHIKRNNNGVMLVKSKILSPQLNSSGYLRFEFKANKIKKRIFIHRLVALLFVPNFNNAPVVNHIDSNPLNNRFDNLEWVSQLQNMHHAIKKGRFEEHFKTTAKILTESNNALRKPVIGTNIKTGETIKFDSLNDAGRHFNNRAGDICRCCKGQRQTTQGYKWQYA